jgi:methylated-DNA-[protein]-cysteine S-methyltransferase
MLHIAANTAPTSGLDPEVGRREWSLEEPQPMIPNTPDALTVRRVSSPLGDLQLYSDGEHLVKIGFPEEKAEPARDGNDPVLQACAGQLAAYFRGTRHRFELPLAPRGTDFQRQVWRALTEIPYGETRSYGEVARAIGRPAAVRAVGAANGRNPLPIVVPCHRVIGSDGSLTGFAWGLAAKTRLLELEGGLPEQRLRR